MKEQTRPHSISSGFERDTRSSSTECGAESMGTMGRRKQEQRWVQLGTQFSSSDYVVQDLYPR